MMNNKTIPAVIHTTLAIGSTASAPYYDVNIQQILCQCACADEKPVFTPSFSPLAFEHVGTNQWLMYVHVEGVIHYIPCGCGSCYTKQQIVSQDFTIPVWSTTEITGFTVNAGTTRNTMIKNACSPCSRNFESDTPITLAFDTAS